MIKIISATNRPQSVSAQIAQYVAKSLTTKTEKPVEIIDLYNIPHDIVASALYENSGQNNVFNDIRQQFNDAEKLIFIVPEYNGSFPGVLKVVIDGLEYPRSVKGKKAALIGLGSGAMGGALALSHLTDILNYLGCSVFANKPRLAGIEKIFDGQDIVDEKIKNIIDTLLADFLYF